MIKDRVYIEPAHIDNILGDKVFHLLFISLVSESGIFSNQGYIEVGNLANVFWKISRDAILRELGISTRLSLREANLKVANLHGMATALFLMKSSQYLTHLRVCFLDSRYANYLKKTIKVSKTNIKVGKKRGIERYLLTYLD